MEFKFELGTPFRPFEQLMGVLPEASKELLPMAFRVWVFSHRSERLLTLPAGIDVRL